MQVNISTKQKFILQVNISTKQKFIYRYREQTCNCQGNGGGRKDWEFGVSRDKLLYIRWINNKVLRYSTGNYIQHPVTNHNGKEHENYLSIYLSIYIDIYT